MSNLNIHNLNSSSIPFFARYLEAQGCQDLSEAETQLINGGLSFDYKEGGQNKITSPGLLDDENGRPIATAGLENFDSPIFKAKD
jgi:Serine endopeptidase inhibitors